MALKPCKECGSEVSTKAFRCPSCGTSNPTLDKEKMRQNLLVTLVGLFALIGIPFLMNLDNSNSKPAIKVEQPSSAEAQDALEHIKGLNWVKDVIYQDFATVQWQIGILDDGRNTTWAAQSICDMLSLRGLISQNTNVRVVDIKKVSRGEDFRKASLGRVNCVTGEQTFP